MRICLCMCVMYVCTYECMRVCTYLCMSEREKKTRCLNERVTNEMPNAVYKALVFSHVCKDSVRDSALRP
jgi:hypothetical protein